MTKLIPKRSRLGDAILALLQRREMKAVELSAAIGLSATSVSKIMNGITQPRQNTFTRMCQVLCKTKEEERELVNAFTGNELQHLEEDPAPYKGDFADGSPADVEILRLRAEQFLERKTQAIRFKRNVARELDKAGIPYQQDYCDGPVSTDFLIEHDDKRIALECKSNLGRDMEKTEAICEQLAEQLNAAVHIVVPDLEVTTNNRSSLNVIALNELPKQF